jgi:iron complex transport system substrate-binding protein
LLGQGLSIYHVDEQVLRKLRPDVIVTQSHCKVCAVSSDDVETALAGDTSSQPLIVSLSPNSLADVWQDIQTVARALGVAERGDRICDQLQNRMAAIAGAASSIRSNPKVLCLEWINPPMAAGNWMPELVKLVNARDPFGIPGAHSPWLSWEQVQAEDPDVIIVMPCGFDLNRTRSEAEELCRLPGWESLRAVRTGRVALADGNEYFNRPGPRLIETLEILAEIVHPSSFDFGHQARAWIPFPWQGQAPGRPDVHRR